MIKRHENIRSPLAEHDPHRDRVSRKVTRPNGRPNAPEYASQAGTSRSLAAARKRDFRLGPTRLGSFGTSMASSKNLADRCLAARSRQDFPSKGTVWPAAGINACGRSARWPRTQSALSSRNFRASSAGARDGNVSVTRPSSRDTRRLSRRALADRRTATLIGGSPGRLNLVNMRSDQALPQAIRPGPATPIPNPTKIREKPFDTPALLWQLASTLFCLSD